MVWNKDKITWQHEVSRVKFYSGAPELLAVFLHDFYFFFSKQQCPHSIKRWECTLFPFQPISAVAVPFRYDFPVSVPGVTEAVIQCFFRGIKIFITKLKEEQCLKFNECAFHGTSTHKF